MRYGDPAAKTRGNTMKPRTFVAFAAVLLAPAAAFAQPSYGPPPKRGGKRRK